MGENPINSRANPKEGPPAEFKQGNRDVGIRLTEFFKKGGLRETWAGNRRGKGRR
jgi:hypothetical protein